MPAVAIEPAAEREEERKLVERAQAGDRACLGELLRRHGPRLYRSVLLPRLGNRAAAEEALAATYERVVEKFDQFVWQGVGVYPWLRTVGLRVALDQLRKKRREVLFSPEDLEATLSEPGIEMESVENLERDDLAAGKRRVEELLSRIQPRYARAIRLRVLEGRTRQEAAMDLEISVATFDVVLHRAVQALRKVLPNEEDEPT